MVEHDMAGRVAGAVDHIQHQFAHRHTVAVLKPAVRLERPSGDSVTAPVIGQPRDPEAVRLMRAFDRHAQFFGKDSGRAAMIDMAMGDENLLYRHAMLRAEEHTSE